MNPAILAALLLHTALPTLPLPVAQGSYFAPMNTQPEVELRMTGGTHSALGTTPANPFTDLSTALQASSTMQQIVVINRDTSGSVCVKAIPWADSDPDATTFDCLGDTPGLLVPAGASRAFAFSGTLEVWIVASEASTDVQTERALFGVVR